MNWNISFLRYCFTFPVWDLPQIWLMFKRTLFFLRGVICFLNLINKFLLICPLWTTNIQSDIMKVGGPEDMGGKGLTWGLIITISFLGFCRVVKALCNWLPLDSQFYFLSAILQWINCLNKLIEPLLSCRICVECVIN